MKQLSREEKVKWIKENCYCNTHFEINLSYLDFGDMYVNLTGIKAGRIANSDQVAKKIYNYRMKAECILNEQQKATNTISNQGQKAENTIDNTRQQAGKFISNKGQLIVPHLEYEQKTREQLIEIIEKLKENK